MSSNYYHEEEILGKAYDSRLMRRLLVYVRPYRRLMYIGIFLSLIVAAMQLALPYIIKVTIDVHIAAGDYYGILRMSLLYFSLLMGIFILDYFKIYLLNLIGQRAMRDMRLEIFEHVNSLSLSFFDGNPVGRLITRITSDAQVLNELFSSGVVAVAGDLFLLLGIVILMLVVNWKLALVVFVTVPVLILVAQLFRIKIRNIYRNIRTSIARINSFLQENLSGMRTIQVYNCQEEKYKSFRDMNKNILRANLDAISLYAFFFPLVDLIAAAGAALLIWYGGGAVIRQAVTIGTLILFIQYINRFFQPIRDLSEKYNILQSAMASSERIFKLLDEKPDFMDPVNTAEAPVLQKSIEFKNVWFSYKKDEYVLKDISFTVPKGATVAIVGATGSGKTSLINLLCRFYDYDKGSIKIDGTELRNFRIKDLRAIIGLVLQDVFLFFGDIASNIRLGNEKFSDKNVQRVAKIVNAHEFISEYPGAYSQEVGERGATFSQGQKQLLAFARALAFGPSLLILDEATSNIDTATELLIQDALEKLLEGRTSIVIAHRLSTIRNADMIIVLNKGRIHETGTHRELLERDGLYRRLYELQYRHIEGM
jgi:ATP-binding cassette, subfamily B, multidrug efflux pump